MEAESKDGADVLAQQVLAMTINDEGPDINSQPSKLWTPRGEEGTTGPRACCEQLHIVRC